MRRPWSHALWMLGFSTGYAIAFLRGVPLLTYFPSEHAWGLANAYEGPAMKWFGKIAWGVGFGLLGWLIGAWLDRRSSQNSRMLNYTQSFAWAMVFIALAFATLHEYAKWM